MATVQQNRFQVEEIKPKIGSRILCDKAALLSGEHSETLRDLIGKRQVTVTWTQADQYGRPVVQAEADGVNVNAEQVRRGFAWAWPRYTTDPRLLDWQAEARAARRGLWADPNPVEPWVWRQVHRKGGR